MMVFQAMKIEYEIKLKYVKTTRECAHKLWKALMPVATPIRI